MLAALYFRRIINHKPITMKNILFTILLSSSLFAQNSEVIYENIFLTPVKASENLLVEGVKKHNQKYHSKGNAKASLY